MVLSRNQLPAWDLSATNPFSSEKSIAGLVGSLKDSVSGMTCYFDSSVPLGYPLRVIMSESGDKLSPERAELLSAFYKQFNPFFSGDNVRITPCVKHALIRLIFYGRLELMDDEGSKNLSRQLDLLHRAVCSKRSNAPRLLHVPMINPLDSELVSMVYEHASGRDEIVGVASRNLAQTDKIKEIADRASAEGKALPVELIKYNAFSGEYERKSLYRTRDVFSASLAR